MCKRSTVLTAMLATMCCVGCGDSKTSMNDSTCPDVCPASAEKAAPAFPQDWCGDWEGRVTARFPGGRRYEFAMRLEVHPTEASDRWTWRIIYGEGEKRQVRDYELVAVDADKGHFRVDEKNSIVIDSYLIAEALYCQFKVSDAQITTTYARHGDDLIFSLLSSDVASPIKTGAEGDIPEVLTYPIQVSQMAVLKRVAGGA